MQLASIFVDESNHNLWMEHVLLRNDQKNTIFYFLDIWVVKLLLESRSQFNNI